MPISVTNSIESRGDRPSCDALNNPLLTADEIRLSADMDVPVMFAPGDATIVQTAGSGSGGEGLGPVRPGATPGQGLGSGASGSRVRELGWASMVGMVVMLVM